MHVSNVFGSRLRALTAIALWACSGLLFLVMMIGFLQFDLYGRRTETKLWRTAIEGISPSILVVLHRILPDQNAVEASVILNVSDAATMNAIRTGAISLVATVTDGSRISPSLQETITLDRDMVTRNGQFIAKSEHFLLPTEPSLLPYPFDDVSVNPTVTLIRLQDGTSPKFGLHVQKALPSRILDTEESSSITLRRPGIQKTFVVIVALIFWFLALIITYELFNAPQGLTSFQELLAVAGFLVTAMGFRDVLGFSRLPATGASEVIAIGFPIVFVCIGMATSLYRKSRAERDSVPAP